MARILKASFQTLLVGIGLAVFTGTALAAGTFMTTASADEPHEQSWYREQQTPSSKPDPKEIVQQKEEIRAEQRMSRLASMQWYGMSNGRPTGSPTPFSTRYSPVWEMPGGRPFSWYPQSRPGYVMYWR